MFSWINKQGVESSDGFVLQSVDRFGYRYTERQRALRIDVEPLWKPNGNYFESISEESFRSWLPPHEAEIITELEKKRLKSNVGSALTFMGVDHQFR